MRGLGGILIATLGTKAQVVTTAVDLLVRDGYGIHAVSVLYPAGQNNVGVLTPTLNRLRQEFSSYPPYQSIALQLTPLAGTPGRAASDVSADEAEAAFRGVYRALWNAKRADPNRPIHLSIVGGRKFLAVYGMAAAQLLFDDHDHLWYVFVGGQFLHNERLHPEPEDEARLMPVPVLRWNTFAPILTDLRDISDPFEAVDRQRALNLQVQLEEAHGYLLGALSAAERMVVELLVREGLTDEQIAQRLSLSVKTVGHHLSAAYSKARAHWGVEVVGRYQLIALLKLLTVLEPAAVREQGDSSMPHRETSPSQSGGPA